MTPTPHTNLIRLLASGLELNDRRTLALASALAQHDRAILLAGIRQAGKGNGPGFLARAVGTLMGAGQGWEWAYMILRREAEAYPRNCFTDEERSLIYSI